MGREKHFATHSRGRRLGMKEANILSLIEREQRSGREVGFADFYERLGFFPSECYGILNKLVKTEFIEVKKSTRFVKLTGHPADVFVMTQKALDHYEAEKHKILSRWPFAIDVRVRTWMGEFEKESAESPKNRL